MGNRSVYSGSSLKKEHMPDQENAMLKNLLCKLNISHVWRIETTEDGGRYRHCSRCGKYQRGRDTSGFMH